LRTLLVLMTVLVGLLVAWREVVEPYRQQRETMTLVEELGGTFQASQPDEWQRWLFGDDFQNLTVVNLADCDEVARYAARIARQPRLEMLAVGGPSFTDEHLGALRHVPTLRWLVLDSTATTDEAVVALERELPGLNVLRSERRAIAALSAEGYVDWTSEPPQPAWQTLAGEEYFVKAESARVSRATDLAHVTAMRRLERLWITYVEIGDAGLSQLKGLCELRKLVLIRAGITDEGLCHLARWPKLRHLSLAQNPVTDAGVAHVSGLHELEDLSLFATRVTDEGLAHLAGLDRLQQLCLAETRITDAGLEHLRRLKRLKLLLVHETGVTDAGAARLQAALPGCMVFR
jgi:hypothetical protein